jgi:putative aldouronate transport system permease protein
MTPRLRREIPLYLMVLPGVLLVLVFSYGPMAGILIAFERYVPARGILRSAWVGLANFRYMLNVPGVFQVLWNTVFIAVMKIAAGLVVPVAAALLLNEVRAMPFKRTVQTIVYLPYFLSWVILAGIFIDLLSPSSGIVNRFLGLLGVKPVFFLGNWKVFPFTLVATETWKNFGFGTIIYLAALAGINPELYEAALVDGAGRWAQTRFVTLPGIASTVVLMTALGLGNILNAGLEQVYNLYSPQVYRSGDIIDTLVYRMGLLQGQYGVSTAIGLFKSVVSFGLIVLGYKLADRFAHYRVF